MRLEINPHFSMVYVEGAAKFIKNYKQLMMHHIAWTEAARPRGAGEVVLENTDFGEEEEGESAEKVASGSVQKAQEEGTPESLDDKCYLVWEGTLRDRSFSEFNARSCPKDGAAKELLGEKPRGYWDQVKNWKTEEEELLWYSTASR
ncbi:hypothetical protein C8F04DRAFT_1032126 [Mycena alexandri]|uniref:Small nuclear ribonucleoprotein Prp3 C-terminal domain-containing protein n=1 Tax=Mycena alexandri TaxID=1745969 RepID=A0AAD6T777_9AGAR|nr:hypothetical protein C8F04DRAFT_1032126 [Mycena alexandri]